MQNPYHLPLNYRDFYKKALLAGRLKALKVSYLKKLLAVIVVIYSAVLRSEDQTNLSAFVILATPFWMVSDTLLPLGS